MPAEGPVASMAPVAASPGRRWPADRATRAPAPAANASRDVATSTVRHRDRPVLAACPASAAGIRVSVPPDPPFSHRAAFAGPSRARSTAAARAVYSSFSAR